MVQSRLRVLTGCKHLDHKPGSLSCPAKGGEAEEPSNKNDDDDDNNKSKCRKLAKEGCFSSGLAGPGREEKTKGIYSQ